MSRRATDVSPWLVAGASLYWAAYAFRIMNPQAVYICALGPKALLLGNVFMLLTVIFTGLAMRLAGVRRTRVAVSVGIVAFSLTVLTCDITLDSVGSAAAVLLDCLDFFTLGSCMMLWGVAFASLEPNLAARNVAMTVALSVAVILGGQAIGRDLPVSWLTAAFTAGSGAIMLSGRVALRTHPRAPQPRPHKRIAFLIIQRAVCGLAIGLFPGAIGALVVREFDPGVMAACLVACAILAAYMARTGSGQPHHVLLALMVLLAPFFGGGQGTVLASLFATLWLCWQTISSAQLSDLKESLGASEVEISIADKVAIGVFTLAGVTLCQAGGVAFGLPLLPRLSYPLLVVNVLALVFMATHALAAIVDARQQDSLRAKIALAAEQREVLVFDSIAREFSLSARERQVMGMLTQGYSSGFIADRLGIAAGTVKAHAAHIYQKLGVRHKDQMLELVDNRSSCVAADEKSTPVATRRPSDKRGTSAARQPSDKHGTSAAQRSSDKRGTPTARRTE